MEGKECVEALFLYAAEGILVVTEKGEIMRMNPSAERLFGYREGEIVGKPIEELVPQRFADKYDGQRVAYIQNPVPYIMGLDMELCGLKKGGEEFPIKVSLRPHSDEDGKFTIAFIVDLTYRREAEEKMKNYASEMELQVKNRTLILESAIEELEKTKKDLKVSLDKEKELN